MADGVGSAALSNALEAVNETKGSFCSIDGDAAGVGSPEGVVEETLPLTTGRRVPDLADVGEAKRERVFRNADLRLGTAGIEAGSKGRVGSLEVETMESRSLWSSSTISMTVLVRVRLCVGAGEDVRNKKKVENTPLTLYVKTIRPRVVRTFCYADTPRTILVNPHRTPPGRCSIHMMILEHLAIDENCRLWFFKSQC